VRISGTQSLLATSRDDESRGFVHKKIGGFIGRNIGGLVGALPVPGAGILGGVLGSLGGGGVAPIGFAPTCGVGFTKDANGNCVRDSAFGVALPGRGRAPRQPRGGGGGATAGMGGAVMGQFGVGLEPGFETIERAVCLPGMILGMDDLCYNRGAITNKQRRWPKGRAPLLTGGERSAITKAAGAARKIERTTKQLQKMGMIKKPSPRRAAPKPKQHYYRPPGTSIVNVE